MKKKLKSGFTIVELIVVIAIIAVLTAVSVISFTAFLDKAKKSSANAEASQIKNSFSLYFAGHGAGENLPVCSSKTLVICVNWSASGLSLLKFMGGSWVIQVPSSYLKTSFDFIYNNSISTEENRSLVLTNATNANKIKAYYPLKDATKANGYAVKATAASYIPHGICDFDLRFF